MFRFEFRSRWRLVCAAIALTVALAAFVKEGRAGFLTVYGSPTISSATGNFVPLEFQALSEEGVAFGGLYDTVNVNAGQRVVRWDGSGSPGGEIQYLAITPNGNRSAAVTDVSNGVVVGWSGAQLSNDLLVKRPVRWSLDGAGIIELPLPAGAPTGQVNTINPSGAMAGEMIKSGQIAVRWDPSGVPTELGTLGVGSNSSSLARAFSVSINSAGEVVGSSRKYTPTQIEAGLRPVTWLAGQTSAMELANLGEANTGTYTVPAAFGDAVAINSSGTIAGRLVKPVATPLQANRFRAIRWETSQSAPTELGILNDGLASQTDEFIADMNEAGVIIGVERQTASNGAMLGTRAVKWDPSGTAPTALDLLPGFTRSYVSDINAAGAMVGFCQDGANQLAATYWFADGSALDLNTLIDPGGPWQLQTLDQITDSGWVGGVGMFDPDGAGGEAPFRRMFTLQVPEPGMPAMLAIAVLLGLGHRRRTA